MHLASRFRFLSLIALCVLVSAAGAAPPITVQGSIKNSGGAPVSGSHVMTFRIYGSATGGTQLWTESLPAVTFNNGIYSAVLGNNSSLDGIFGEGLNRWLGVTLDGGTEFTPRQQLSATPYALHATNATTASSLDGVTSTGFALAGHTHPKSYMFVGNSNGSPVVDNDYLPISGGDSTPNQARVQVPAPANMTFTKLALNCELPTFMFDDQNLTLWVNNAPTSLTVAKPFFATYWSATGAVAVIEGDLLSLHYTGDDFVGDGISFALTAE